MRSSVVAAGIDDDCFADPIAEGAGKFRALMNVTVQREEGLAAFDPAPQRLAPDVSPVKEHVASRPVRRAVDYRNRPTEITRGQEVEFLFDRRPGVQIGVEILNRLKASRRP